MPNNWDPKLIAHTQLPTFLLQQFRIVAGRVAMGEDMAKVMDEAYRDLCIENNKLLTRST